MTEANLKVAAKVKNKVLSVNDVVINDNVSIIGVKNPREIESFDVGTMRDQIFEKGRITNPPQVEKVTLKDGTIIYVALRGNRRIYTGQIILKDPSCPADLKWNLEHTDCLVYEGLTADERLSLIHDHGETSDLNRYEIIQSVWAMADRNFANEGKIGKAMYYDLAKFSGRKDKLRECQDIMSKALAESKKEGVTPLQAAAILGSAEKARDKYVSDWFRGTLGQYILAAYKMGPYVKEQFLLTARDESKLPLKPGEVITMRCEAKRILELKKAQSADIKDGSWNPETGHGNTFDALVKQFQEEDAGTLVKEVKSRPSVKSILDSAASFRSPLTKVALRRCAGEELGNELYALDEQAYLLNMKLESLGKVVNQVDSPEVKALIAAIIYGDVPSVETALKPFLMQPAQAKPTV